MTSATCALVNTIIYECAITNDKPVNHTKLQKIMYFCYGQYLVKYNTILTDETFQAWKYGCVIPSVYDFYKTRNDFLDFATNNKNEKRIIHSSDNAYAKVANTIKQYCNISANKLTKLNHHKEGAWSKIYHKGKKLDIPMQDIINEFKNKSN